MWRTPSRATSYSVSSSDCDQWLSRRPKSRRWASLPERSLTISMRISDDVRRRPHEGRRERDVERARGIEIHHQTGLAEVLEGDVLRVFAAHDACGELRGMTAAVFVVAGHDDHGPADGLRFLEGEDREVRATRGLADAPDRRRREIP